MPTCPACNRSCMTGMVNGVRCWICPACFKPVGEAPVSPLLTLREPTSGAELVQAIRLSLIMEGYTVLRIGQRRADRAGTDSGTPDTLILKEEWGPLGLLLEVKYGNDRLSPEQEKLVNAGIMVVARSVTEALAHARVADERMRRAALVVS